MPSLGYGLADTLAAFTTQFKTQNVKQIKDTRDLRDSINVTYIYGGRDSLLPRLSTILENSNYNGCLNPLAPFTIANTKQVQYKECHLLCLPFF